ncbi:MAG: hypothetical protein ACOH14_06480 [Rhodoglobus sp.]
MPEDANKEPGNWELYRGIERIEKNLNAFMSGTVTTQVFAVEKAALVAADAAQAKEIAELRAARVLDKAAIDAAAKAQEEQKSRNRLFLYGLIGSPIAVLVVTFIINGGLRQP